MLTRRYAGRSARWGMVLTIAALMAFVSAGAAQESQTESPKVNKPIDKAQEAQKPQKASPEVQKARAEIKSLIG